MALDLDLLRTLYPAAPEPHLAAFAEQAPTLLASHGIAARMERLHVFLAQIGHETAALTSLEEAFDYSALHLTRIWPERFPTVASARPCARSPERLADLVHGGRMGNGPDGSGDGWRFRSRGYLGIAGREAYAATGEAAGLDLLAEPDLAARPDTALLAACGLWSWKGMNSVCDTGDFGEATRRLTGGDHGMAERRCWLERARQALIEPEEECRLDIAA